MVKIIRRTIGIVLVLLAVYMIILSNQQIIEGEKYYHKNTTDVYLVHHNGIAIEYNPGTTNLNDIDVYVYSIEKDENGEKVHYLYIDKDSCSLAFSIDYNTDGRFVKPKGYLELGIVSAIVGLALFIPDIIPKKD